MLSYFEISPFHSAKGRKIAWARLAPELSSWMDCQEGFPKGTRRAEKRSTYGLDAWQKSIFIYMNGTWTGTLKWSESWVYSPVKWVPWTRCWRQANHTGSGLGTWDWELGTGYWGPGYLCFNGSLKLGVRVCAAIAVKYVCTKGNRQSHVCRKCWICLLGALKQSPTRMTGNSRKRIRLDGQRFPFVWGQEF